jgi:hypothetical protein
MEHNTASTLAQAFSARNNPALTSEVTAIQANLFLKFKGLESFSTYETASGSGFGDPSSRSVTQIATDLLYRFLENEKMFVGVRYNSVTGTPAWSPSDVTMTRIQAGLGWFVTPNILAKIEYVNQDYADFSAFDIKSGGNFNGLMNEGTIGF